MPKLNYSIVGLEDFSISFQKYCVICEIQKYCKFGKESPFSLNINCGELNKAKEQLKLDQLQKLQKTADLSTNYEDLVKSVKINMINIISQIWKDKVKSNEEIRCLNSTKVDSLLVAQQAQDWWQDFSSTMKDISIECEKIR